MAAFAFIFPLIRVGFLCPLCQTSDHQPKGKMGPQVPNRFAVSFELGRWKGKGSNVQLQSAVATSPGHSLEIHIRRSPHSIPAESMQMGAQCLL